MHHQNIRSCHLSHILISTASDHTLKSDMITKGDKYPGTKESELVMSMLIKKGSKQYADYLALVDIGSPEIIIKTDAIECIGNKTYD